MVKRLRQNQHLGHNGCMANTKRNKSKSVKTDRFSEQTRKSRRESQSLRYDAFDSSQYGDARGSSAHAGAEAYSRRVSQGEYTKKRKQSKRKKIAVIVIAAVLTIFLGGAGAAFAYYNTISDNLHEGLDLGAMGDILFTPEYDTDPFYVLLMGVDGSEERSSSAEYSGDTFRSDSMMLARVDPGNNKVAIVSIHRDILVDMGEYGKNKINAAHALGGAPLAVEVVSELAGVPISHYAQINFDGFREVVDALGGVEVDVPMTIDDPEAGGYVAAGPQTLNGEQALVLCRSRHSYDDYGDGDTFRAANQRLVIGAIAKKILQSDLPTMATTVTALSEYVTTDYDISEIITLAQSMQGLDPANDFYSAMTPTTSAYVNETWYEYLDTEAWKTMMARVDQGLPPTEEDVIDPISGTVLAATGDGGAASSGNGNTGGTASSPDSSSVPEVRSGTIVVKNGSGVQGVAAEAGKALQNVGYTVQTGNADSANYQETLIIYSSADQAEEAQEIAKLLGVGKAQLNDGTYNIAGNFLVVVGHDW